MARARLRQSFLPRATKRAAGAAIEATRQGWQPHRLLADHLDRLGISHCIDVGANVGQFATDLRMAGFTGTIVSYEPDPVVFAALERRARADERWRARNRAVAPAGGIATLHVSENSGLSSSLLSPTREAQSALPGTRTVSMVDVTTVTWSEVFSSDGLDPSTTFVKLDCQGLDVPLLDSMRHLGIRPAGVQCEIGLVSMYHGSGSATDLLGVLDTMRLHPVDIRPGVRDQQGRLLEMDVLAFAGDS